MLSVFLCLLLFAAGAVPSTAQAQEPTLRFERLTPEDGLLSNKIDAILQDSQGFLWFGTNTGLNKYDGYTFTAYKHNADDPTSISDNAIFALYEDSQGTLWVGTQRGLNRFDRDTETFTRYQHDPDDPTSLSDDWVGSILEDAQGNLWFGTVFGGINRFDREQETFTATNVTPDTVGGLMYRGSSGTFWVGNAAGLHRFDPETLTFTPVVFDAQHPERDVFTLFEDSQGMLWIGTTEGVYQFDPETSRSTYYAHDPDDLSSLSHNFVRDIQEDETGTIWIATQGGGLNRFDPQTGTFRHHRNDPTNLQSISSDILSVLYEDRAGLLWIGTRNGGVNTFDPHTRAFRSYTYDTTQPQSLSKGSVAAIYQDNQDILWIGGFDENGLTRFDRTAQTITRYQHDPDDPDSLPYDNIYDIDEDRQGTLWIGTIGGGVATFDRDTETFTSYQHDPDAPDSLSNDVVPVIFEDSQGILWIGTEDGLNIFDRDTETFRAYFHQADNPNSLADSEISAMYEDENGTLWIATWGGGLNRFDRASRTFEHFLHDPDDPQSISDNRIYWLTGDGAGTLWLGTRIGLNRFDIQTGTATRYTEQDGLPTNSALCAQVDAAGDVWVSTNRGLARFDPEQERFTTYSTHDGLSSDNFTGSTCFQNTDGELFFGTVNGFVAFHPEDMTRRTDAPPVVLTGLDILNEPVDLAQDLATLTDLTLAPTDQVVTFAFAALDYADPSSNQYAYQLAGFDAERVQAGDQRRVTYTNLDPGSYTFRVWGSNSDGIWNEAGRALSITVLPPWWETSWFRGAMLGLLVGFVVGGFQWRTQMIRQHNRLLEQQVADRTHDLDRSVQQLQQALDVTRFLYTVSQRISTAMSVEEVIAAYLEQVAAHGRYACSIVLFEIDHQGQRTAMIMSGRWAPQDGINLDELRWDFVHAPFTPRLDAGQTVTFADVRDHPQVPHVLQNMQAQYGQVALAIIPLMVRGTRIGIVLLGYPHPYTWQEQDLQPFQTTAAQLSTAIDSRRQHLALSVQQQQVAVLEERHRLARDLHDSATQSLFSISLLAQVVPDLWEVDQQETHEALQTIRELTRGALAEMRALLFELRPADAEGQSLPQMLQQQASAFERRTGFTVVVEAEDCPDLPDEVRQALLRIAQEALNNIRKHAQAQRVHISLQGAHPIRLCVVDNGRGFDPSQVGDTSFGLISMRERAAAINARLTVCSAPGEGTEIRVDWPEPAEQHAEEEKAEDAQA